MGRVSRLYVRVWDSKYVRAQVSEVDDGDEREVLTTTDGKPLCCWLLWGRTCAFQNRGVQPQDVARDSASVDLQTRSRLFGVVQTKVWWRLGVWSS